MKTFLFLKAKCGKFVRNIYFKDSHQRFLIQYIRDGTRDMHFKTALQVFMIQVILDLAMRNTALWQSWMQKGHSIVGGGCQRAFVTVLRLPFYLLIREFLFFAFLFLFVGSYCPCVIYHANLWARSFLQASDASSIIILSTEE